MNNYLNNENIIAYNHYDYLSSTLKKNRNYRPYPLPNRGNRSQEEETISLPNVILTNRHNVQTPLQQTFNFTKKVTDDNRFNKQFNSVFSDNIQINQKVIFQTIYLDGMIYFGPILQNRPHGHGKFISSNGTTCEGEFLYGKRVGEFKTNYKNGDIEVQNFVNGVLEGKSFINYASGDSYTETWKEGKRDGKAKYCKVDGTVIEGKFVEGKKDSQSTIYYPSGSEQMMYVGERLKEKPHGQGKMYYQHGVIYDGAWNNGEYDGVGKLITSTGKVVSASFKNGVISNSGEIKIPNEYTYEGEFSKYGPDGKGTKITTDGLIINGAWKQGKVHGKAILTYPNGDIFEGSWDHSLLHGKSLTQKRDRTVIVENWQQGICDQKIEIQYTNGDKYEGEGLNGLPHGQGIARYSNGLVYSGNWEMGVIVGEGNLIIKTSCNNNKINFNINSLKMFLDSHNSQDQINDLYNNQLEIEAIFGANDSSNDLIDAILGANDSSNNLIDAILGANDSPNNLTVNQLTLPTPLPNPINLEIPNLFDDELSTFFNW